ncbi:cytochrome P450 [Novosphingobium sp. CCH12-A3]|uniref:cytochrome P450 n=1 Tax=Novosphingobium sp. CCH12-A3 TaxID=1768752 RepID=UPI001E2A3BFA|nr:cytochrome P450 [Novosphingobium sp. CCH12-A3]
MGFGFPEPLIPDHVPDRMADFMDWEMNLLHNHDLSKIAEATRKVVAYLSFRNQGPPRQSAQ